MKRKILIFIVAWLILVGGLLVIFFNSDYYYSKKLVSAIRDENIIEVQNIINCKPNCINTYPSITPRWWHSAMNWRVCYPLNVACDKDNVELIKLLLENGADPNCNDGLTPLAIVYNTKLNNWYNISLLLIENGASLDYITEYSGGKSSILLDIVDKGSLAMSGYERDEVNKAFNYALENCDHSKVNWLRVLQHSVTNDRIEIVKLLLEQGYCNVNDTSLGITALMFAARHSTPEMVQLLIDYGADKNIKSDEGETAYDYALESNNKEIIEILED